MIKRITPFNQPYIRGVFFVSGRMGRFGNG